MSCSCTNISNTNFTVVINNSANQIIIDSQDPCTPQVNISCNSCETVEIIHYGPNGGPGSQGPSGSCSCDTGSFVTTSSFNSFTSSYNNDSSSFNSRINNISVDTSSFITNSQTSSMSVATASFALNSTSVNVGGTTGSVQYNLNGDLAGNSNLLWDINNDILRVTGTSSVIVAEDSHNGGSYLGGYSYSGHGLFDLNSDSTIATFSDLSLNGSNNIFLYGGGFLRYFLDGAVLSTTGSMIRAVSSSCYNKKFVFTDITNGLVSLDPSEGNVTSYFVPSTLYLITDLVAYNNIYTKTTSSFDGTRTYIQLSDTSITYNDTGSVTNYQYNLNDEAIAASTRIGNINYTEGINNINLGYNTTVGGNNNKVFGTGSLVRGIYNKDFGNHNLLLGYDSETYGSYSIVNGYHCNVNSAYSFVSGMGNISTGQASHVIGISTIASGVGSHSEGLSTTASANYSHAGGVGTIADTEGQYSIGKYNNLGSGNLFSIGNGSDVSNRSDILGVNTTDVKFGGGIIYKTTFITDGTYNVLDTDYVLMVDTSNNAVGLDFGQVTLTDGKTYIIKDAKGTFDSNNTTLYNAIIDSVSDKILSRPFSSLTIIYHSTYGWSIISAYNI